MYFNDRKSKKDGKQESKLDRESDLEKARSNAALWELRLQVTEQSLTQYRESCRKLARANEELTNELYRVEEDAVDTTRFFNKLDVSKEEKVCSRSICLNVHLLCNNFFALVCTDSFAAGKP